jgi:flagellar capping protein FliD
VNPKNVRTYATVFGVGSGSVLGVWKAVESLVGKSEERLNQQINKMEERFNQRINKMEEQMNKMEERINQRLDRTDEVS